MFKFAKRIQKEAFPSPQNSYFDPIETAPQEPELIIGKEVSIIGKISFQREIHINGLFEGELEGNGKVVIGPEGFVKADLNIQEAEIAGKVEGNVTVKDRLVLHGTAEVRGNITAPRLSVDEGVSIIGQVHVTSVAIPEEPPF